MEYNIWILLALFYIYSIVGWMVEIIYIYVRTGKIVDRGFMIGPYCPIYGVGCIIMILLLSKYRDDIPALFIMSAFTCGTLEYITSYIMEKLFKTRWWDYSFRKYNINGRICLETLVYFGLGAVIILNIVNPFVINIMNSISFSIIRVFVIIVSIIFVTDFFVSFKIIFNVKKVSSIVKKDSTEEMSRSVKEVLFNKSKLYQRLAKAFPDFITMKGKIKDDEN